MVAPAPDLSRYVVCVATGNLHPSTRACKACAAAEVRVTPVDLGPKGSEVVVKGRSHFNAKATVCERGHRHDSKVEARVCASVYVEAVEPVRVYRNVRLPLWCLAPTATGIPMYARIDFAVVDGCRLVRLIDAKHAKAGHASRDWARGRAAVESTYGLKVEERSE